MDKQHILHEIKRTAQANGGKPLGRNRFLAETGIREADWLGKYWARWGEAVTEAGYSPNELNVAYADEFLILKYVSLTRELGRLPASGDLRLKAGTDREFPTLKTFDRLGSKSKLLDRVVAYCQQRTGYEDVVLLCKQYRPRIRSNPNDAPEAAVGFVYLMKSGRYFKIGRSNAAGRREYELGIQLPDEIKSVHTIRTDDPPGIEGYWHRRFADKRKKGEWFELDAADVAAFKRRKFM